MEEVYNQQINICTKTHDSLEISKNIITELKNENDQNLKKITKLNNVINDNTND